MKKNILALVLLFITMNTYSQMHISTNMRENFVFNDNNKTENELNSQYVIYYYTHCIDSCN